MKIASSIRSKLTLAFSLSALPVLLISGSMTFRQPAQFSAVEEQMRTATENIELLRMASVAISSEEYDDEARTQHLQSVVERIGVGEIRSALSNELAVVLHTLMDRSNLTRAIDIRSASGLIDQVLYEEQGELEFIVRDLLGTAHRVQMIQALQVCIAFVMVFVLSSIFSKHFSIPLEKLTKSIEKIRAGNLGVQTDFQSDDEIGLVIEAFNEMSHEFQSNLVSKKYLNSILENIHEGLVVLDANGIIEFANPSICNLAACSFDQLIGVAMNDFISEFMLQEARNQQGFLKMSNNEFIPVTFSIVPGIILENDSKVVVSIHDERIGLKLRKEREEYRTRLAHNERLASLGTLSGEVAHRLNQPLTSLRLFLQQSRRRAGEVSPVDEKLLATLQLCLAETGRASDAVKSILHYTRRDPGSKSHCMVKELVEKSLQVVSERLQGSSIKVEVIGDSNQVLRCVGEEIEELLFILLSNAIDAIGDESGHIEVNWTQSDDGLSLSIADSGKGIAAADIDRIFDVFFTTKPAGKGTGLGLCIAHKIATDHNALIRVENLKTGGACFVVKFKDSLVEEHMQV